MLLIDGLDLLATFDDQGTILENASILIDGPVIRSISTGQQDYPEDVIKIDGREMLALPGFINTHHHFFQQLTRADPLVHDASLIQWLLYFYPLWYGLDADQVYAASRLAIAQLLLTGCTTTSDMTYLYPRRQPEIFDATIQAARDLGIRFHPVRAALLEPEPETAAALESKGLDMAELCETPEAFFAECERVIAEYHDPSPLSMCQVGLGLTEKTYHQPQTMRSLAAMASQHDMLLHTHLHPRSAETELCQQQFGLTPLEFLEENGWLSPSLWIAHGTALTDRDIALLARNNVGVSHCPSSNMRLGMGVMPLPDLAQSDIRVGIGVDGGSSNDSGDILGELRLAYLIHRVRGIHREGSINEPAISPHEILRLGTGGGGSVLQRSDLGSLVAGNAADIILYDLKRFDYAGALSDPIAALLLCGENHHVDTTIVNGKVLVEGGRLVVADEQEIADDANHNSELLYARARSAR